ncbi:acyl carrier protein [Arenibaculum sp.]|uniref:acyl carrier protein n=1 Tax=Arenibaculum sp. TaxID=2865862 RepID=UPI002E144720|nr:phosphopantetheine-binding protein [Arenibaculum sp.]
MSSEWTRDSIILFIKKDLLLENLDLASDGLTLDGIQDDTPLLGEGLSIDSVDAMDLLVGIEKKFGLDLPDLDGRFIEATCRNVGTLADFVVARLDTAQRA